MFLAPFTLYSVTVHNGVNLCAELIAYTRTKVAKNKRVAQILARITLGRHACLHPLWSLISSHRKVRNGYPFPQKGVCDYLKKSTHNPKLTRPSRLVFDLKPAILLADFALTFLIFPLCLYKRHSLYKIHFWTPLGPITNFTLFVGFF